VLKLTATGVRALKEPGSYGDGAGLMLVIGKSGSRSWIVRVKEPGPAGKRRDFGLGSATDVSLGDARKRAAAIREQVKAGMEPVAFWKLETERVPTFQEAATRVHEEVKKTFRNGKHAAQWLASLEAHAYAVIGDKLVDKIDTTHIRDVFMQVRPDAALPLWLEIPETARRVRQRIGTVLDWAHAKGYRPAEAPMRSVTKTLPRQPRRDRHFAALPYPEVPALLKRLREDTTWARLALEATILTATRSGEIRGAKWSEVDLEKATWTIPAERMKGGKAHVVPLSDPAIAVFKRADELRMVGELVFPGRNPRQPMSDMTMTKLLRDLNIKATVHGFRSAFRDWVAEETRFPSEIAEAALAHAIPNRVEAAYRRTDFLAKRRQMMAAWASFLEGASMKVVRLAAKRKPGGIG